LRGWMVSKSSGPGRSLAVPVHESRDSQGSREGEASGPPERTLSRNRDPLEPRPGDNFNQRIPGQASDARPGTVTVGQVCRSG
jgi:hypothetical protein